MEKNNIDFSDKKISVVIVTYSNRWFLLKKVLDRILKEKQVSEIILVDNASEDKEKIDSYINLNKKSLIKLIRFEKNFGSAKGFSSGVQEASKSGSDYVLLLDDDNLPEEDFINKYFESIKNIKEENFENIVLTGNRNSLSGNDSFFYNPPDLFIERTFFNVFSIKKIKRFLFLFKKAENKKIFHPIVQVASLAYSESLIPIGLVRKAKLPDENLFTYGDDIEYSWNLIDVGAKLYLSSSPIIKDLDDTFNSLAYFEGLFSKSVQDKKVYLRIRNSVILSLKHKAQNKLILILNIIFWYIGVNIFMLVKLGLKRQNIKRSILIFNAIVDGFKNKNILLHS